MFKYLHAALLLQLATRLAALQEVARPLHENPTLPRRGRVAIVLRGMAFRCRKYNASSPDDGVYDRAPCCPDAIPVQEEATASLVKHVIRPLESQRTKVDVVVTDGICNLTAGSIVSKLEKPGKPVLRFAQWDAEAADRFKQNANIRFALETFKGAVPGGSEEIAKLYDLVLVLRHDMVWKLPINQWPEANFSKFNFPSRCEEFVWETCINDVFHTMPGRLFPAFDQQVGTNKCFFTSNPHKRKCMLQPRCKWDSGHWCLRQVQDSIGEADVGVVTNWRPARGVRDPNQIFELYNAVN